MWGMPGMFCLPGMWQFSDCSGTSSFTWRLLATLFLFKQLLFILCFSFVKLLCGDMTHLSFRRARWYDFRKILEEAVAPRYSLLVSLTGETPSYYSLGQCNQDSKLEADGGG